MTSIQKVLAGLESFPISEVDEANVLELYELFDGVRELPEREALIPAMFALAERYPSCGFGMPGPLFQETIHAGAFVHELRASMERQPTDLGLTLISYLLNQPCTLAQQAEWLGKLREAKGHPKSTPELRQAAEELHAHHQSTSERTP